MTNGRFYELLKTELFTIENTLKSKGNEYSTIENKLHNFDKAGRMSNQSRERALMGMLLKHQVSVDDIVDKLEKGELPTFGLLNEKIGDIINYYILLKACIVDRIEKKRDIDGTER